MCTRALIVHISMRKVYGDLDVLSIHIFFIVKDGSAESSIHDKRFIEQLKHGPELFDRTAEMLSMSSFMNGDVDLYYCPPCLQYQSIWNVNVSLFFLNAPI